MFEVILVDNVSRDGTLEFVQEQYPQVRIIRNSRNVGFTVATNQGVNVSTGKYILWLNTDTVLLPDCLERMVAFLRNNPKAGIVGPKVLNEDGSFQYQCRRGLPTPFASMAYFLGLHKLFQRSSKFNSYLLSLLPEDRQSIVAAVSGCCLMGKRDVLDHIGPLDEAYFGFGEDIDWCVRAKKGGWQVWYYPGAVMYHLKGKGGVHAKPFHKLFGIHQAMWLFYWKNFGGTYPAVVSTLGALTVIASFLASCAIQILRKPTSLSSLVR